ncbi:MAG: glycosyltransferase [Pseudomonadota bacterium]|nr:glycosyltransferase [Pseudomonadota bacterium]
MKIALYSHDTMGLGHIRRNLLIARALAESPLAAKVLLIAGIHEAGAFRIPKGVDCLTLPAYSKDQNGKYSPRSLFVETNALVNLRSQVIGTALTHFNPNLFIVDNVPRGALQELSPVLANLKFSDTTRTVLGLRDIIDHSEAVRRQWQEQENEAFIERFYEAVWVYGDPDVYDQTSAYSFSPSLRLKTTFTGYLDPMDRLPPGEEDVNPESSRWVERDVLQQDFTLCVIGGGQDGLAVASAFAKSQLPEGEYGIIVTGPFLPEEKKRQLRSQARENPRLRVLEFLQELMGLMQRAKRIIAMGGYNTVTEILSLGKPALIVPRNKPRLEQTIRAERLRALGVVDVICLEDLNPAGLSRWLHNDRAFKPARNVIDLGGLEKIPALVSAMFRSANVTADHSASASSTRSTEVSS